MPNWCSTSVTIQHEDEEKVKAFYNLLESFQHNAMDNDFGKSWLGNLVLNGQIGSIEADSKDHVRCRGWIDSMEREGDVINVWTETAWVPMMQLWKRLCDKYLPEAEITFTAEENGCGLYWTNDSYLAGHYNIQSGNPSKIESNYEATEEQAKVLLQNLLNTKEQNIETLLKMFDNSGETVQEQVDIHPWHTVQLEDME